MIPSGTTSKNTETLGTISIEGFLLSVFVQLFVQLLQKTARFHEFSKN